jgi:hypothetical protein
MRKTVMRNCVIGGWLGMLLQCLSPPAATAQGPNQFGGLSQSPYLQNSPYGQNSYYNPGNQPLSPYLNMLRGGNPAVNYFYGVRPAQNQGAFGAPFLGSTGMYGRQTFFPNVDTLYELDDTSTSAGMRPTGHPFGFNNTLGYFGMMGTGAQRNATQGAMSGKKSAMGGK